MADLRKKAAIAFNFGIGKARVRPGLPARPYVEVSSRDRETPELFAKAFGGKVVSAAGSYRWFVTGIVAKDAARRLILTGEITTKSRLDMLLVVISARLATNDWVDRDAMFETLRRFIGERG